MFDRSSKRVEPNIHSWAENPSPFAISTHVVTRTIPYSRRGVGRPWDGANKFSEPISLTLTPLSLSEESWITTRGTWCCAGMANVLWSFALRGMAVCLVYPSRHILRFASSGDHQRRRTARVLRAATHNCVSTRSVCGQLDNVMNVDIFPNADITYDPPPSVSVLLSLFYHHALSSLRDDVRQYRISFTPQWGW